ncbi:MAG: AAA family ATPase [Firmicutes bacterium]|nr:AAA family ATPase [Bacillota bacterium]
MKWSMDTHKYMSEITRTALSIIVEHNITVESEPEEIDVVERELVNAGVYKDYNSAKGRVRRALFTYFKAYGCLDDNEHLTELGRLFVERKITIKEFCFHYILNYQYEDEEVQYYPVRLILTCLKKLSERGANQAYLSAYDFSRIVECQSLDEVNDALIDELVNARVADPIAVNERTIGFDIWAKMLVQAGILKRTTERTLMIKDQVLADWILHTYENQLQVIRGTICTGVFKYLPTPPLNAPTGDATRFVLEGRALQAYLFDAVDNTLIYKYIFNGSDTTFDDMLSSLGLTEINKGFYKHFLGLERLMGYCLSVHDNPRIKIIGNILASVELTEAELTEVMSQEIRIDYDLFDRKDGGKNVLLYGVPGSGKSWTIEHEYCNEDNIVNRLVFHPDYTNADFVGQILPVVDSVDKQVTYEFTPGPFTTILCNAYRNPMSKYILIIEEINRGNAPAIFGEVFQLLDRKIEKLNDNDFPVGTSEYGITHKYMAEFVYGNSAHRIRIPSNLSIIGTMNTSDQNVFTLDTAFQRRWQMRLIENNFDNVHPSLADAKILDTDVTWKRFCETINTIIVGNKAKMASAEDKRLGVYFVHENDLAFDQRALPSEGNANLLTEYNSLLGAERLDTITEEQKTRLKEIREAVMDNRLFPEKVIKYLWDDAFKFNPEALFDTENMDNLEKVIRTFIYSIGHDRFKIFKQSVYDTLYAAQQQ